MPARLQLVVPCYNEAARLAPDAFLAFLAQRQDAALLFVDDGSRDATPQLLASLAARSGGRASALSLPRNMGKGEAVRRGIVAAIAGEAEFVGYWDADLSTPLAAVGAFVQVLESAPHVDVVLGSRVKLLGRRIDRGRVRHYGGRIFATAAAAALGIGVYDTQCGAKLFRVNDAIRTVFDRPFSARWAVDVEILARYLAIGGAGADARLAELPLEAWTAAPGSKLRARDIVRAFWDLALIARRRRSSLSPPAG